MKRRPRTNASDDASRRLGGDLDDGGMLTAAGTLPARCQSGPGRPNSELLRYFVAPESWMERSRCGAARRTVLQALEQQGVMPGLSLSPAGVCWWGASTSGAPRVPGTPRRSPSSSSSSYEAEDPARAGAGRHTSAARRPWGEGRVGGNNWSVGNGGAVEASVW